MRIQSTVLEWIFPEANGMQTISLDFVALCRMHEAILMNCR